MAIPGWPQRRCSRIRTYLGILLSFATPLVRLGLGRIYEILRRLTSLLFRKWNPTSTRLVSSPPLQVSQNAGRRATDPRTGGDVVRRSLDRSRPAASWRFARSRDLSLRSTHR